MCVGWGGGATLSVCLSACLSACHKIGGYFKKWIVSLLILSAEEINQNYITELSVREHDLCSFHPADKRVCQELSTVDSLKIQMRSIDYMFVFRLSKITFTTRLKTKTRKH